MEFIFTYLYIYIQLCIYVDIYEGTDRIISVVTKHNTLLAANICDIRGFLPSRDSRSLLPPSGSRDIVVCSPKDIINEMAGASWQVLCST